jgi:K+-sensing histidine kinase KdpD
LFVIFFGPILLAGVALIPITVALAILRYRLWDISVIVRRTLLYALLTAILAIAYFGIVTLLQRIFAAVSDQQSPIVIVISTLIIAALFTPLRRAIQEFLDRRFYRRKYDADRILANFAQTARDEVDLERLMVTLLTAVEEAMEPEQVSLWIREMDRP